jgi:hypothetical protein
MNAPDVKLADHVRAEEEHEGIKLLRKQAVELSTKSHALQVKLWVCLVFAIAGIVLPVVASLLWNAAHTTLPQSVNEQIKDTYRLEVKKIVETVPLKSDADADAEQDIERLHDLYDHTTDPAAKARQKDALDRIEQEGKRSQRSIKSAKQELKEQAEIASSLSHGIAFGAFCLLPLLYIAWISIARALIERAKHKIEYRIIQAKSQQLQDNIGQDFFTTLVKINFKYLDQYYFQTQEQANKSFALSVGAAIVGLFIVVVGIALMYWTKSDAAYVTTASGIISQFIAAVFFYLYNRTILRMGEYHQKLVLTQNIGIALKITDLLPETERAQTQQTLVSQLMQNINQYLTGGEAKVPAQE